MRFRVGDRVKCNTCKPDGNGRIVEGSTGVVCDTGNICRIGVRWDEEVDGHTCHGRCDDLHGWYIDADQVVLYGGAPVYKTEPVICGEHPMRDKIFSYFEGEGVPLCEVYKNVVQTEFGYAIELIQRLALGLVSAGFVAPDNDTGSGLPRMFVLTPLSGDMKAYKLEIDFSA